MGIFDFLNSTKKKTKAVGLDVGMSAIKVVEVEIVHNRLQLNTYGSLAIGPYGGKEVGRAVVLSEIKLAEAIRDLVSESKVSQKDIVYALPLKSSFIRLIDLPAVAPKELQQMMTFEARKYVPVPINDVSLDWQIIPDTVMGQAADPSKKRSYALLVAIYANILSFSKSMIEYAGLTVDKMEIEGFSISRAVLDGSDESVLVCDIGASSTKFYLIKSGMILRTHHIAKGGQDLTLAISRNNNITVADAELLKRQEGMQNQDIRILAQQHIGDIADEIHRLLTSFETHWKNKVSKVVLVGAGCQLQGLAEFMNEKLKLSVTKANPFSKTDHPAFLDKTLQEIGPEFAGAVGAALRALS